MPHPLPEKTQAERFEAARELGPDESGEAFESAMARIFHRRGAEGAGAEADRDGASEG